ncbi:thioester-containing protein 1 allele R1-like isoform X2 [Galleria mellonella]|nr:thioester-containing protein 1 allele R1-like isoform X2 [Galleria mellonella]XP_052755571.1 thioester-containing protein 1 allele R1-like isoform X2 [Galleria mellonella]
MMDHRFVICCIIVVISTPTVIQCISVVGPKVLRPFSTYSVAIAGGSRAHNLYVAVEGRRANGEQFTQGQEVQVQAATSRHVEFNIGDLGPGQYSLVARSTSGPLFSSSAPLVYQQRSFCIFVQTDKRVYNPGDTINLRVIALNKYLLPLTGTVDVNVLDAGGSPVRQWAAVTLDRGLFTDLLTLADEPALGEWTIQVEIRGQTYSRQILVADYVMPKFQMDLQMSKELLFSEGRFTIDVTAKHFNGLPVRGELTISAYIVFFSGLLQPVYSSPSRKVFEINGNTQVTYDLKTDLDLAEDEARPLVIEAVIEEKDTLIRQNVSSRILLLRTPYRLKVTAPDYFKPNLPYNVQIEVTNSSGEIMNTDGEITVERLWDDGAPPNTTTVSLKNGFATYTIIPEPAYTNSTLNLQVRYKEVTERVVNVQSSQGSANQYLTMELLTRGTSVGDEMRARITATEPMDLVHYVVIGRGDILMAKTLELNPVRRSVDISIPVTAKMSPGCVLLAWYPRLDAARYPIVAAAVYAPQRNLLQHKVSLWPAASNVRPSSVVEVQARATAGSLAAVLVQPAAAARAGLADPHGLGTGLDMHTIEREVESFIGLKHSFFKNEDYLPGAGVDISGSSSMDVFQNVGVVILTDGVIIQNNKPEGTNEVETGTRPPLAGPYAFSRLPPPPAPRYYLTEPLPPASDTTRVFSNFTIGSDGKSSTETRSPGLPSELTVGGFAIDPNLGLGLAEPTTFSVTLPLSITLELPTTMQKGETLAAIVVLKNTLTVDLTAEVTFYNSDQYFEFEPLDNDVGSSKKIELFSRASVKVPAQGTASTAFLVTIIRDGSAPVMVEATGGGHSHSISRTIDVKDGYEEDLWSWSVLDARNGVARERVTLQAPAGTRPGGALLSAAGELVAAALAAALSTTGPAPAADPPHAIRPLALACVLIDYLQTKDQPVPAKIHSLVSTGFQRLMSYRRQDGSFAPETDSEVEGDVWTTSVCARWLARCARHVQTSPEAGVGAARWLAARQLADGSWPPARRVLAPRAQRPLPLTAHALLALLQTKGSDILYKDNIDSGVEYIARGLSPQLDAYTLAVAASALAAARSPHATIALQMLDQYGNTTGSAAYWSRHVSGPEWRNPWLRDNSVDAATASWGLRALLSTPTLDSAAPAAGAMPLARYLLQTVGPYDPDPDVVDALAQFSESIRISSTLRISVNVSESEEPRQFQIMPSNAFVIQNQQIRNVRNVSAMTEGRGVAILGLSAKGYTNVTAAWPRYTLDPRVDQVSTSYRLQLSICVGFVAQSNDTESGLTLLTVQLPSGYLADINTLTELTSARHVVRARLQAEGARVAAWMRVGRAERCATLAAPRALPAARQRAGWATLIDLYDSSHRARQFFQPVTSTACDVCREWPSCERACGAAASQRAADRPAAGGPGGPGGAAPGHAAPAAPAHATTLLLLLTLTFIVNLTLR